MIKYLIPLLFVAGQTFSQQNLKENFTPLKSSGTLPDIFTQNIRNVIKDDISDLYKKKETDKSIKQTYLTETNYEIQKIVKSGNTLVNDEITAYLNKLADVILKDNQPLRKQLHIYTLKSPVVNAYSYDKGYIFIDIGLIAQAETEAQLAYILCHEITHYTKKHHINGYVKNKKIDNQNYTGKSNNDIVIEKCQYSKELESEADLEGFKLFEQTNYNFKQAEKAFDVLQYAHLPFELVEFKKSFFETEYYKIPDSYLLKEVSSIRNNSNEDDTKLTHPNTAKRKQAIIDLTANRNNAGKVNFILDKAQFEYVRDLSRFELCRLYLKNRDYPNALYAAYILSNKYPDNQYLAEIISKSLYGITLYGMGKISYDHDSHLENGFPEYKDVESYPQQLYYLMNKMPNNEWTMMSLNYVYRNHKKYPNNKVLNRYSDSLFKLVNQVSWGIIDFVRINKKEQPAVTETKKDSTVVNDGTSSKTDLIATIQKENNFKKYDTAYYKEMYVDLFMTDKEFSGKFPSTGVVDNDATSGFSDYSLKKGNSSKKKKPKKVGAFVSTEAKVNKVLLLEPFYLKIDESQKEEFSYLSSDEKQEKYAITVNDCAQRQKFELVTLDPDIINANDVDKMNDYAVINDWFAEKFDSDHSDGYPILNTNDIENIISKYNTQYVFKTGIVNYKSKSGRKRTYYYAFVYDLKLNEIIYKKQESFKGKDSRDLINAKVYQTIYEFKQSNK